MPYLSDEAVRDGACTVPDQERTCHPSWEDGIQEWYRHVFSLQLHSILLTFVWSTTTIHTHFGRLLCNVVIFVYFEILENGGSRLPRNVCKYLSDFKASHSIKSRPSHSLLWEFHVSYRIQNFTKFCVKWLWSSGEQKTEIAHFVRGNRRPFT